MKKIFSLFLSSILILSLSSFALGGSVSNDEFIEVRKDVDIVLKYIGTIIKDGKTISIDSDDYDIISGSTIFGFNGSYTFGDDDKDGTVDAIEWDFKRFPSTTVEKEAILNNLSILFSCAITKKTNNSNKELFFWVDHNAKLDSLCGVMMYEQDGIFKIFWSVGDLGESILNQIDKSIINHPLYKDNLDMHSTPAPKATKGIWQLKHYVDKFGDPTDEAYISNKSIVSGSFNNSATTKSKLDARFLIDDENISIKLYEYGNLEVKNYSNSSSQYYDISMKRTDGTKVSFTGKINPGSDRITVDKNARGLVLRAFYGKEGNVSFYIEERDHTVTNYLLTVECDNFKEIYDSASFE